MMIKNKKKWFAIFSTLSGIGLAIATLSVSLQNSGLYDQIKWVATKTNSDTNLVNNGFSKNTSTGVSTTTLNYTTLANNKFSIPIGYTTATSSIESTITNNPTDTQHFGNPGGLSSISNDFTGSGTDQSVINLDNVNKTDEPTNFANTIKTYLGIDISDSSKYSEIYNQFANINNNITTDSDGNDVFKSGTSDYEDNSNTISYSNGILRTLNELIANEDSSQFLNPDLDLSSIVSNFSDLPVNQSGTYNYQSLTKNILQEVCQNYNVPDIKINNETYFSLTENATIYNNYDTSKKTDFDSLQKLNGLFYGILYNELWIEATGTDFGKQSNSYVSFDNNTVSRTEPVLESYCHHRKNGKENNVSTFNDSVYDKNGNLDWNLVFPNFWNISDFSDQTSFKTDGWGSADDVVKSVYIGPAATDLKTELTNDIISYKLLQTCDVDLTNFFNAFNNTSNQTVSIEDIGNLLDNNSTLISVSDNLFGLDDNNNVLDFSQSLSNFDVSNKTGSTNTWSTDNSASGFYYTVSKTKSNGVYNLTIGYNSTDSKINSWKIVIENVQSKVSYQIFTQPQMESRDWKKYYHIPSWYFYTQQMTTTTYPKIGNVLDCFTNLELMPTNTSDVKSPATATAQRIISEGVGSSTLLSFDFKINTTNTQTSGSLRTNQWYRLYYDPNGTITTAELKAYSATKDDTNLLSNTSYSFPNDYNVEWVNANDSSIDLINLMKDATSISFNKTDEFGTPAYTSSGIVTSTTIYLPGIDINDNSITDNDKSTTLADYTQTNPLVLSDSLIVSNNVSDVKDLLINRLNALGINSNLTSGTHNANDVVEADLSTSDNSTSWTTANVVASGFETINDTSSGYYFITKWTVNNDYYNQTDYDSSNRTNGGGSCTFYVKFYTNAKLSVQDSVSVTAADLSSYNVTQSSLPNIVDAVNYLNGNISDKGFITPTVYTVNQKTDDDSTNTSSSSSSTSSSTSSTSSSSSSTTDTSSTSDSDTDLSDYQYTKYTGDDSYAYTQLVVPDSNIGDESSWASPLAYLITQVVKITISPQSDAFSSLGTSQTMTLNEVLQKNLILPDGQALKDCIYINTATIKNLTTSLSFNVVIKDTDSVMDIITTNSDSSIQSTINSGNYALLEDLENGLTTSISFVNVFKQQPSSAVLNSSYWISNLNDLSETNITNALTPSNATKFLTITGQNTTVTSISNISFKKNDSSNIKEVSFDATFSNWVDNDNNTTTNTITFNTSSLTDSNWEGVQLKNWTLSLSCDNVGSSTFQAWLEANTDYDTYNKFAALFGSSATIKASTVWNLTLKNGTTFGDWINNNLSVVSQSWDVNYQKPSIATPVANSDTDFDINLINRGIALVDPTISSYRDSNGLWASSVKLDSTLNLSSFKLDNATSDVSSSFIIDENTLVNSINDFSYWKNWRNDTPSALSDYLYSLSSSELEEVFGQLISSSVSSDDKSKILSTLQFSTTVNANGSLTINFTSSDPTYYEDSITLTSGNYFITNSATSLSLTTDNGILSLDVSKVSDSYWNNELTLLCNAITNQDATSMQSIVNTIVNKIQSSDDDKLCFIQAILQANGVTTLNNLTLDTDNVANLTGNVSLLVSSNSVKLSISSLSFDYQTSTGNSVNYRMDSVSGLTLQPTTSNTNTQDTTNTTNTNQTSPSIIVSSVILALTLVVLVTIVFLYVIRTKHNKKFSKTILEDKDEEKYLK